MNDDAGSATTEMEDANKGRTTTERDRDARTEAFILKHLTVVEAPGRPDISIHTPLPTSRLSRFLDDIGAPDSPYWAYLWAGGLSLARYLGEHPEAVAGRRVIDLGAGCGVVGIAAALAGARAVTAVEIDPNALTAIRLNAGLNGAAVVGLCADLLDGEPPDADVILVGDLFYEKRLAERLLGFLDRCLARGMEVLIGDPMRAHLPLPRLESLGDYRVRDFGDADAGGTAGSVFRLAAGHGPRNDRTPA